jgi:hypothetical protein
MKSATLSMAWETGRVTPSRKRQGAAAVQNVTGLRVRISRLRLGVRRCSATFGSCLQ